MKKYFCVETDEEIQFGEVITLTLYKDIKGGKVIVEKEVEFSEDTMDWLIEMGFVQERDSEKSEILEFAEEPCDTLANLIEDFETLEERVDKLEEVCKELKKVIEKGKSKAKNE